MKFKIVRSKFIDGLKSVQNIVAGKGSLPILQNVLLEAKGKEITMTTTDLDISIKASCGCEVEEAGSTTLPVKLLFNAITKVAQSNNSSYGATLYVTTSPCIECSKLIIQSGIKRVVFGEYYRITDGVELLKRAGIECIQLECVDGKYIRKEL
mgnify:CR=1 FL=1